MISSQCRGRRHVVLQQNGFYLTLVVSPPGSKLMTLRFALQAFLNKATQTLASSLLMLCTSRERGGREGWEGYKG